MSIFNPDIQNIIYDYEPRYQLLNWIDKNKLINEYFKCLLKNPHAINIIEEMIDECPYILNSEFLKYGSGTQWKHLSCNKNAVHILEHNLDEIYWPNACAHLPISFIEKYNKGAKYSWLSQNETATKYFIDRLEYFKKQPRFYMNPSAFEFLDHDDMINNISWLSMNPKAITFLKNNKHIIYWGWFLSNKNGIDMIKEEINKPINRINKWYVKNDPNYEQTPINYVYRYLSKNENAMDVLKNNQHLIYWCWFATNKGIFKKIKYLENIS